MLWLAAILLLLSVPMLSSCLGGTEGEDTSSPPSETTAANTDAVLTLASGGATGYRVIYHEDCTAAESAAAIAVAKKLSSLSGADFELESDLLLPGRTYAANGYEILVGSTGYDESRAAVSELAYGGYSITVVGDRVVIAAAGEDAIARAAESLAQALTVEKGEDGGILLTFAADTCLSGNVTPEVEMLPRFGAELDSVYDTGDGAYMIIEKNAEREAFDAYVAKLEALGFAHVAATETQKGCFVTLYGNSHTVYLGFYGDSDSVRIISQRTAAPSALSASETGGTVEPVISFVGLARDTKGNGTLYGNGLSLILRLSDGSFLIADGGGQNTTHAELVYSELRRLATDPDDIRISAWFITHAHIDHAGVFHIFSQKYADKVTLERLIWNIPTEKYLTSLEDDGESTAAEMARRIRSDVDRWKGLEVIKAHVGQEYYFADARVMIYATADMLYPAGASTTANSTSVVFKITTSDGSLMVTGDADTDTCGIMCGLFGTELKSDAITVVHHGYTGGTTQFYSYVAPRIVLWPASQEVYEATRGREYNKYLLDAAFVERVIVAHDEIYNIEYRK